MSDAEVVTPAALLRNLNFDSVTMDTNLAKDYIKNHDGVFHPLIDHQDTSKEFCFDSYGNKIFYFEKPSDYVQLLSEKPDSQKLKGIAKKVEGNGDLFAQLEYLIRKSKIEDVKKYDISILSKTFEYYAETLCKSLKLGKDVYASPWPVVVTGVMPLAGLGIVAQILHGGHNVEVICDLDTAVIGHLFVTLCHEAGFSNKNVSFSPAKNTEKAHEHSVWQSIVEPNQNKDAVKGSVVAVTEKSDLDSVVENIVAATHNHKYPWRLRQIIVQETVYERFQKALKRKNDETPVTSLDDQLLANVKAKSAYVHITNGKIFLFDYADVEDNIHNEKPVIYVEGYRTTKELLSLLKKHEPSYLSLWCNNVSVKDEIVFGTDARHIWINDFGVFDDPRDVGYSLFAEGDFCKKYPFRKTPSQFFKPELNDCVQKVSKLRENWMKKDMVQRRKAVIKAMANYKAQSEEVDQYKLSEEIDQAVAIWKPESLAKMQNGILTIGLYESVGIVTYIAAPSILEDSLVEIIKSVLNGNGIIIPGHCYKMIDLLEKEEVPIVQTLLPVSERYVEGIDMYYTPVVFDNEVLYKKKLIKSKFGETFAN